MHDASEREQIRKRCLARTMRWIRSQQIAVAAFECSRADPKSLDDQVKKRDAIRRCVCSYVVKRCEWHLSLPPTTLNVLGTEAAFSGLMDEALCSKIRMAGKKLVSRDDRSTKFPGKPTCYSIDPPLAKAASLASAILYGTGDARRVVRFASALFPGARWPIDPSWRRGDEICEGVRWDSFLKDGGVDSRIGGALCRLRSRHSTALDRLDAVTEFCELIDGTPWSEQVENALLQHCFAWPLLVGGQSDIAIAFPVLVDAWLPDANELPSDVPEPIVEGKDLFDLDYRDGDHPTFKKWLQIASDAAWLLWRGQHGSVGDFREIIRNYTAYFDLTFAGAVVDGVWPTYASYNLKLPLISGSASAYLSQVLLARLLGRRAYFGEMITGAIGDPPTDRNTGDELMNHKMVGVEGVKQKLRYVFASRFASSVVVPQENAEDVARLLGSEDEEQTAPVYSATTLATVADIVQTEGWRRTHYVRCPELGWEAERMRKTIRDNPLGFKANRGMNGVLRRLNGARDAVIELSETSASVFSHVLQYVDVRVREYGRDNLGRLVRMDRMPPGLTWAIIRLVAEEDDVEFWNLVWKVIGATPEDLERFSASATTKLAADLFIEAMNRHCPDCEHPSHRAPDILVLVDYELAQESFDRCPCRSSRPLAPAAVLNEVKLRQAKLDISTARKQHQSMLAIGAIRIVLMKNGGGGLSDADKWVPRVDPKRHARTAALLNALAVFRWGFTHHMASAVLQECGRPGSAVKRLLTRLERHRVLRSFGEHYFIPKPVMDDIRQGYDCMAAGRWAHLHYRAAESLAPYTRLAQPGGLTLAKALLPAWIVESRRQFAMARDEAITAIGDCLANAHKRGLNQTQLELKEWSEFTRQLANQTQVVERSALLPSRMLIDDLLRRREHGAAKDAEYLAQNAVDSWRNHNSEVSPHPMLLLDVARAQAAGLDYINQDQKQDVPQWRRRVVSSFCAALQACKESKESKESLMATEEREWCRIHVLCWFSEFLYEHEQVGAGRELAGMGYHSMTFDRLIWDARKTWIESADESPVTPAWLERRADDLPEAAACRLYQLGSQLFPQVPQFRFKSLGASIQAGSRLSDNEAWMKEVADAPFGIVGLLALRAAAEFRMMKKRRRQRWQNWTWNHDDRLNAYWQAACDELSYSWRRVPGLQHALWAAMRHQGLIWGSPARSWIRVACPAGWE